MKTSRFSKAKLTNLVNLFTVLLLLFSGVPVSASEGDGQSGQAYLINFQVLKDGTDEISAADQYTQKPAKVTLENGISHVELTLLKSDWISEFEVDQAGVLHAATVIDKDEAGDKRTVRFQVDNVGEKINTKFVVEVPGINYKGEHYAQLSFDTTDVPKNEQSDEEAVISEGEKDDAGISDEGSVSVDTGEVLITFLKDGTDEPSSLGNYTSKTGQLHERDGAYFLTFTLSSSSLVTVFQYESGEDFVDAIVLDEDKDADIRSLGIVVTDANQKQNVALEINAGPRGVMRHIAQIVISPAVSEEIDETERLPMSDIQDHWAKSNIEKATAQGLLQSFEGDKFKPDSNITRAEIAVILVDALQLNQSSVISDFVDIADIPEYAVTAISQLRAEGLMVGYGDGTFRPNASLDRAQLAVIIAKIGGLVTTVGAVTPFNDANSIPVWAQPSVVAAVDAGLISGRGNNLFAPTAAATRAEVVTLLVKVLQNVPSVK